MGFFDDEPLPDPPPEPPPPPWAGPPQNELGVGVPIQPVLADTDEVVVAAANMTAYSTGLTFDVVVHARAGPGRHPRARGRSPGRFRFGVRYPDGRRATDAGAAPDAGAETPTIVLEQTGGHGGERSWENHFWLWPLPPAGPLELVCQWPHRGIDLRFVPIDGGPLRAAAARSRPLWPAGRTSRSRPARAVSETVEALSEVRSVTAGEGSEPVAVAIAIAPPEGELGTPLPLERTLVHTDEAAAAIRSVVAYRTGVGFTLAARHRHGDVAFHGVVFDDDPLSETPARPMQGNMRLAVRYADGKTAATGGEAMPTFPRGEDVVLYPHRGSAGDHTSDQRLWLAPPPPDGPVTFAFEWPAAGLPEHRVEVDAAELRAP